MYLSFLCTCVTNTKNKQIIFYYIISDMMVISWSTADLQIMNCWSYCYRSCSPQRDSRFSRIQRNKETKSWWILNFFTRIFMLNIYYVVYFCRWSISFSYFWQIDDLLNKYYFKYWGRIDLGQEQLSFFSFPRYGAKIDKKSWPEVRSANRKLTAPLNKLSLSSMVKISKCWWFLQLEQAICLSSLFWLS